MRDAEPWDSIRCAGGDERDWRQMAEMRESTHCQGYRGMWPGSSVQLAIGAHNIKRHLEELYRRLGPAAHRIELIDAIERCVEAMDHYYRLNGDRGLACQVESVPHGSEG